MQEQFGDSVNIIGVAGRDTVDDMEAFVSENGVSGFAHIADVDTEVWARFGVRSQPAFVFINDDGTSETLTGGLGSDGLTERIEALIAS